MSYSLTIRAASKEAAKQAVAERFDAEVAARQLIHKRDRDQAVAAAGAFIDLLEDDETKDVSVSMHGSLSWADGERITGASVSVGASLTVRTVA
jgi:hypothetical protein